MKFDPVPLSTSISLAKKPVTGFVNVIVIVNASFAVCVAALVTDLTAGGVVSGIGTITSMIELRTASPAPTPAATW